MFKVLDPNELEVIQIEVAQLMSKSIERLELQETETVNQIEDIDKPKTRTNS